MDQTETILMENPDLFGDGEHISPFCNTRCSVCSHPALIEITKMRKDRVEFKDIAEFSGLSTASLSRHFTQYKKKVIMESGRDLSALLQKEISEVKEVRNGVAVMLNAAYQDVMYQYSQGRLIFTPDDFIKLAMVFAKLSEDPNAFTPDTLNDKIDEIRNMRLALPNKQQVLGFTPNENTKTP